MAASPAPNSRASLLAGLRTGGVRSVSGPIPHTASPAGTFNVPRYAPASDAFYSSEEEDELADLLSQKMYFQNNVSRMQQAPMTAAVDGGMNRFVMQQALGMNGGVAMNQYAAAAAQSQMQQAMQMQMMQLELARLQAQQYQAELIAQAQLQRQVPQPQRRTSLPHVVPASAGPANTMFDMRANMMGAQGRRPNQADQLRAMLGVVAEDQVPMTAALGGRFGSRYAQGQYSPEEEYLTNTPATPSYTNVLSGGTALGGNSTNGHHTQAPSKSDAAVSWRRAGSNSVLGGNRSVSSPMVKITPPPTERTSPSPVSSPLKTRPPALRFTSAQPLAAVAIDHDGDNDDSSSASSSKSGSTPSTPRTASSLSDAPPLSPREEATKKLYEGLGIGIGRANVPSIAISAPPPPVQRIIIQPSRQPVGPPSNHDDTVLKNFATRGRRKAIGALGALLDARERREGYESA